VKLISFRHQGRSTVGALVTRAGREVVLELNRLDPDLPADMLDFLAAGQPAFDHAQAALAKAAADPGLDLKAVTLQAPIPRPGKIICIGQNYLAHAKESNDPAPPFPIIFAKFANTVIAHREPIVVPASVEKPDYEGELAVVMGRRGRDIPEEHALDYVAGYMPLNDVSARDWQHRTSQWTIGKTPDTFCPMGPALVTADEVPDVQNLSLRTIVSGEVLQEGHTSLMIFPVRHLIADMSRVMTLEPGDVIATGTPSGIGAARTPPRWLRPGDTVRVEIDGLLALENPVAAE
jgi:2-keto-4-pentenoate hydratase/2-oxohepta-3-ene-1,7-dioic acid hydratase in catechol pathway